MKLHCNRKQLDDALGVVARATASRSALPILSHLYLEALDDSLRLIGSDMEQWVECRIPAIVGETGAPTVSAKLLSDLVGSLSTEEVNLETGERHQLILQAGESRYQLVGLPADQYPPIPELESNAQLSVPASLLREMVESVEFAVAPEKLHTTLTGVLLEYDGTNLRLVSTDTHRLAVRDAAIGGGGEPASAIVPLKAIHLLQKLPASENFTLQLGAHRAAFLGENASLVTQLIEGQYPNYQRVIPQEYTRRWVLMVEEFRDALRRAYLIAKNNARISHTYASKSICAPRARNWSSRRRATPAKPRRRSIWCAKATTSKSLSTPSISSMCWMCWRAKRLPSNSPRRCVPPSSSPPTEPITCASLCRWRFLAKLRRAATKAELCLTTAKLEYEQEVNEQ
jgi:DNA polymerase-3 subunit beta